jgi:hypothetical protein
MAHVLGLARGDHRVESIQLAMRPGDRRAGSDRHLSVAHALREPKRELAELGQRVIVPVAQGDGSAEL